MAIIGQVERKNWKVKLLNVMIHVVLILGATTMVYPLLLMLSGSVKSDVDFKNFTIYPEYLSRDMEGKTLLFRKYLATKFNRTVARLKADFKDPDATFDNVTPPTGSVNMDKIRDYSEFLKECKRTLPHYWFHLGMAYEKGVDPLSTRNYREFMQRKYGEGKEGLQKINAEFNTKYQAWDELALPSENFFIRRSVTNYDSGMLATIREFKYSEYVNELEEVWPDMEGDFITMLRRDYGGDLVEINAQLGMDYNSWEDITLSPRVPTSNPVLAEAWGDFIKAEMNLDFISIDVEMATPFWHAFLKDKYKNVKSLNEAWKTKFDDFEKIALSSVKPAAGVERTDWQDFCAGNSTVKKLWPDFLKRKYGASTKKFNAAFGTDYQNFSAVKSVQKLKNAVEASVNADKKMSPQEKKLRIDKLFAVIDGLEVELEKEIDAKKLKELPREAIIFDSLAIRYRQWLKNKFGENDIRKMNTRYGNGHPDFSVIPLPAEPYGEKNLAASADWIAFVDTIDVEKVQLVRRATDQYRKFIKELYKGDFSAISVAYGVTVENDNSIPVFLSWPGNARHGTAQACEDYRKALKDKRFSDLRCLEETADFEKDWHAFLEQRYSGNVERLNVEWHLTPMSFDEVIVPAREHDWILMEMNDSFLRWEYLKRNYLMVFNTLFTNGNAALNTLIYCFLAVLAALLVNPLCAYGLSRYKPASTYKILLFLMLPMAFPGMVLGIPQFLLVKNFGLLNTFAALILPGMASGYSIFLLKGFFDSLPKELFESAAIDGASEWTVFWHIAMGLSTPILSVIALGAFTAAYGNFMMAFLLCQDKSMWTMMVYLFQLQQRASPAVGFAALAVAAIPTLIVFIFCQNIIIKGIVVPTEK